MSTLVPDLAWAVPSKEQGATRRKWRRHVDTKAEDEFDRLKSVTWERYRDVQYLAMVTDATTGRTEPRNFTVRLTKEPVHIYLNPIGSSEREGEYLISTSYADGTPAPYRVTLDWMDAQSRATRAMTVKTNRYGLAKVTLHFPSKATGEENDRPNIRVTARDAEGRVSHFDDQLWTGASQGIWLSSFSRVALAPASNTCGSPVTLLAGRRGWPPGSWPNELKTNCRIEKSKAARGIMVSHPSTEDFPPDFACYTHRVDRFLKDSRIRNVLAVELSDMPELRKCWRRLSPSNVAICSGSRPASSSSGSQESLDSSSWKPRSVLCCAPLKTADGVQASPGTALANVPIASRMRGISSFAGMLKSAIRTMMLIVVRQQNSILTVQRNRRPPRLQTAPFPRTDLACQPVSGPTFGVSYGRHSNRRRHAGFIVHRRLLPE
jgi:hypothetical protein